MSFIKKNGKGLLLCLAIAVPCWFLGNLVPVVGGPVFAIIAGMILALFIKDKTPFKDGITFTSKKILQYAVILLGFGMNLSVVLQTGKQSLPIIISTISTSLILAFVMCRVMHIPGKISTLIGVGSSICGGSAIAATAPVIDADEEEVAQAISVIFFFNVLAAVLFPTLGAIIGFATNSGEAFGIFRRHRHQRHLLCDGGGLHMGHDLWAGLRHAGQGRDREADTHAGHHSHHAGAGTGAGSGEQIRGRQGGDEENFPVLHFVFHSRLRHHDGEHQPRRAVERVHAAENAQQVFHRAGHGRHRAEHRHCEAGENRRQAARHGLCVLGRHYLGEPCDAACDGALVRIS